MTDNSELTGQITQSLSGYYDVRTAAGQDFRTRARGNLRHQKQKPVVGDRVVFTEPDDTDHLGYLLRILPRTNVLSRPPVANIDLAVVVTAAKEPDLQTSLLDRQLLSLEQQHIQPVIYLTKSDLLTSSEWTALQPLIAGYRQIGYPVLAPRPPFSAAALATLVGYFEHRLVVLTGQTGAGKSTLLNHLNQDLALATREISTALNRGKHTTRRVALYPVGAGLVADTPGFSAIDLATVDKTELPQLFPEFVRFAPQCRFRSCLHLQEPGCAVKAAVAAGAIMASRYANYQQLQSEAAERKPRY
ncbi:MAG: ribosome small subunit-dependent GTPase A [Schleiferilactobacillus perolens]|uniref:ribosome small subunit-dependent GTPase A n=1 Tax=Schleiferilactobacillus perolens TaxID=100468 RepID=UPI0039E785BD